MFEQKTSRTNQGWTFLAGLGVVCLIVLGMILIPLAMPATLPLSRLREPVVAPPQGGGLKKKAVRLADTPALRKKRTGGKTYLPPLFTAPPSVPKGIPPLVVEDLPGFDGLDTPGNIPGGPEGPGCVGCFGDRHGFLPPAVPKPPREVKPTQTAKPEVAKRVFVSTGVQAAKALEQIKPVYPPLAKQVRVQGLVRLNAVIAKDGTVQNLAVVSGHPLLVPAAIAAVRTWRYQPTLLNGEAVEVATVIDINFTLTQ